MLSAIITFIVLTLVIDSPSSVDQADKAMSDFYSCIELKHKEALCESENEKAYQLLNKLDVEDHLSEKLEEDDFHRVAGSCWATFDCETYSCLNKNLWRCQK